MTPENFCYWLQGLFEVGGSESLNSAQTQIVKDHLALVFSKVTPQYPYPIDIYPDSKRKEQNLEWNLSPVQIAVWNKDNWSYGDLRNFHSTGISVNFYTALEDYKKDGNVSKHGTIGFIAGPNGGHISTSEFSSFLEKTNSGQNVPPIKTNTDKYLPLPPTGTVEGLFRGYKTNLYFGSESSLSIEPNTVIRTC